MYVCKRERVGDVCQIHLLVLCWNVVATVFSCLYDHVALYSVYTTNLISTHNEHSCIQQ